MMRDIFEDIYKNQPLDPMESARQGSRPNLRRKFYALASVGEGPDGHRVLLDGKPVRTPAKRMLAAPNRSLADALATEWQGQPDVIDPLRMPRTRLANSIIDGVADSKDAVADEIVKYLGSDLLFYRAGDPAGLVERQAEHWDPVIAWARDELGARFILAEGVVHVAQPPEAVTAVRSALPQDAWRLGALHVVTTLTGSALLGLALAQGALSLDAAWAAAHVDEDWQMTQWGRDDLALERRAFRRAEMEAAADILEKLRG
jgi:chaperone required for assembly of F1-ATPase